MSWYQQHVKHRLPIRLQRALAGARNEARARWGAVRVRPWVTRLLGPQFRRSRSLLEIDLTYACNLRCFNCNRSCEQLPGTDRLTLAQINRFLAECVASGTRWERVRVLGGEPTLHPEFFEVLDALRAWRDAHAPDAEIAVTTNGHGAEVLARVARIPPDVAVNNTAKASREQEGFALFNVAPIDAPAWAGADFSNGCWITTHCGTGLTPTGIYPCAVAGGIDRVMGWDLGRPKLPEPSDDMLPELRRFCAVCGHFNRSAATADPGVPVQSPSWVAAYAEAKRTRPRLTPYGANPKHDEDSCQRDLSEPE